MGDDLLDFVSNAPLRRDALPDGMCPVCFGEEVTYGGKTTTLVGGGERSNHTWEEGFCDDCEAIVTREQYGDWEWYCNGPRFGKTAGVLILGVPVCFESYQYKHSGCGGVVIRQYCGMDGETNVWGLCTKIVDGVWQRQYRTFFKCLTCNEQIETDYDYWPGR